VLAREKNGILGVGVVKENANKVECNVTHGLPEPPFFLTVVAPRKSGKTNLVIDLLTDKDKLLGKFDAVFIWSRTFYLDPKWKNIDLPPGSIFTEFIEEELAELMDAIEETYQQIPISILLVFDDMVTEKIMNSHRIGQIDSVAVRGRHSGTSCIIISQQYLSLSPPVRNNTTNMVIFRVRNGDEMEKIARENREWLEMDEFKKLFFEYTNEPYSFMHINNQRQDPKERFHKIGSTMVKKKKTKFATQKSLAAPLKMNTKKTSETKEEKEEPSKAHTQEYNNIDLALEQVEKLLKLKHKSTPIELDSKTLETDPDTN